MFQIFFLVCMDFPLLGLCFCGRIHSAPIIWMYFLESIKSHISVFVLLISSHYHTVWMSERITQPEYVGAKFGCSCPNLHAFFQWRTAFCELVAFKFHAFHFLCLLVSRMDFQIPLLEFFSCFVSTSGICFLFCQSSFFGFFLESTKFSNSIVWLFDIITVSFQHTLGFFLRRGLAFHFRHFVSLAGSIVLYFWIIFFGEFSTLSILNLWDHLIHAAWSCVSCLSSSFHTFYLWSSNGSTSTFLFKLSILRVHPPGDWTKWSCQETQSHYAQNLICTLRSETSTVKVEVSNNETLKVCNVNVCDAAVRPITTLNLCNANVLIRRVSARCRRYRASSG